MSSNQKKIEVLSRKVDYLCDLVIKTRRYAQSDPETSLVQARLTAEAICLNIFNKEIGKPGNIMLDGLIKKLTEKEILPKRIKLPLKTIQTYGNYAAHARLEHEPIQMEEITPCLTALAQLTSWYFTEYLKTEVPPPIRDGKKPPSDPIEPPQALISYLPENSDIPPEYFYQVYEVPLPPAIDRPRTNWRIMAIAVALALVLGIGGIWFYQHQQQAATPTPPEIPRSGEVGEAEEKPPIQDLPVSNPSIALCVLTRTPENQAFYENKLYHLLKSKNANLRFKSLSPRQFDAAYGGNFQGFQSDLFTDTKYFIVGELRLDFAAKSALDADLISCDARFSYTILDSQGNQIDANSLQVVGIGFSQDKAVHEALEELAENHGERIVGAVQP